MGKFFTSKCKTFFLFLVDTAIFIFGEIFFPVSFGPSLMHLSLIFNPSENPLSLILKLYPESSPSCYVHSYHHLSLNYCKCLLSGHPAWHAQLFTISSQHSSQHDSTKSQLPYITSLWNSPCFIHLPIQIPVPVGPAPAGTLFSSSSTTQSPCSHSTIATKGSCTFCSFCLKNSAFRYFLEQFAVLSKSFVSALYTVKNH